VNRRRHSCRLMVGLCARVLVLRTANVAAALDVDVPRASSPSRRPGHAISAFGVELMAQIKMPASENAHALCDRLARSTSTVVHLK
jgi:hypothetical protein